MYSGHFLSLQKIGWDGLNALFARTITKVTCLWCFHLLALRFPALKRITEKKKKKWHGRNDSSKNLHCCQKISISSCQLCEPTLGFDVCWFCSQCVRKKKIKSMQLERKRWQQPKWRRFHIQGVWFSLTRWIEIICVTFQSQILRTFLLSFAPNKHHVFVQKYCHLDLWGRSKPVIEEESTFQHLLYKLGLLVFIHLFTFKFSHKFVAYEWANGIFMLRAPPFISTPDVNGMKFSSLKSIQSWKRHKAKFAGFNILSECTRTEFYGCQWLFWYAQLLSLCSV